MSAELLLYVYDYNYSSWSMRAGLALRQTGAAFKEVNAWVTDIAGLKALSPSARFPLLQHDGELIWDSLAIGEYLHELFPSAGLWPAERKARAHARAVVAEMHSGFGTLREAMPMNIRAHYPGHLTPLSVRRDITRITDLWETCLERSRARSGSNERYDDVTSVTASGGAGPFLFGSFTLADAFFAPVVMRFTTYDVPLSPALALYAEAVRTQPYVKEWLALAAQDPHVNPNYDLAR